MSNSNPVKIKISTDTDTDNSDPSVWGKYYWYYLNTLASYIETKEDAKIWIKLFLSTISLLRCMECRGHAKTYAKQNSPIIFLNGQKSTGSVMLKYMCKFHNVVNLRLKKPLVSENECFKLYPKSTNTKVWGPIFWYVLHNSAAAVRNEEEAKNFITQLKNTVYLLKPTEYMEKSKKYIETTNPPEEYINTEKGMSKYVWTFHNFISGINKPYFEWETCYNMYLNKGLAVCTTSCGKKVSSKKKSRQKRRTMASTSTVNGKSKNSNLITFI